jgi:hypothetical protein
LGGWLGVCVDLRAISNRDFLESQRFLARTGANIRTLDDLVFLRGDSIGAATARLLNSVGGRFHIVIPDVGRRRISRPGSVRVHVCP